MADRIKQLCARCVGEGCDACEGSGFVAESSHAAPAGDELGWLLEGRSGGTPVWWTGHMDPFDDGFSLDPYRRPFRVCSCERTPRFTSNANEAIRFSRREDAERAVTLMPSIWQPTVRPSEHMWPGSLSSGETPAASWHPAWDAQIAHARELFDNVSKLPLRTLEAQLHRAMGGLFVMLDVMRPQPAAPSATEPGDPETDPWFVLDFCEGAIADAIFMEDGLDGAAGERVIEMIRAARTAHGKPNGPARGFAEDMDESASPPPNAQCGACGLPAFLHRGATLLCPTPPTFCASRAGGTV